ncbi:MAG: LysM peptidoglycan-binding domain-containing protein [Aliarcobacter sp.]|jgi:LysM repeat protein|nr:LysM peptidoglycan-binding domain-containing protein [Aliarcobacter sp.]
MATITTVSLDNINTMFGTTVKSPIDVAANIKGYAQSKGDTLDTAKMIVSTLSTLETFASAMKKYETPIPGTTLASASLILNLETARRELRINEQGVAQGQIQNGTLNSIMADITSLTAQYGLSKKSPQLVAFGMAASFSFSVAAILSTDGDTSMANGIVEFASNTYNTYNYVKDDLSSSYYEFTDTLEYIWEGSNILQSQYLNSGSTQNYGDWIADTNNSINVDDFSLVGYLKEMGVNSITNDNQTYTIKSGDTLYSIAQSSNVTVDELLQANPWLEEQGRVNEDKSYVLIKTGETINISKDNNTYSYDIENSSVSIKDASNNPLALESISNDILMNISDGYTTLNTQTKTLDLNSITTVSGGYGAIVNVKEISFIKSKNTIRFYQANLKKVA